jgi:hypothetical protein
MAKYTFWKYQVERQRWVFLQPTALPMTLAKARITAYQLRMELGTPIRAFRELKGGLGKMVLETPNPAVMGPHENNPDVNDPALFFDALAPNPNWPADDHFEPANEVQERWEY